MGGPRYGEALLRGKGFSLVVAIVMVMIAYPVINYFGKMPGSYEVKMAQRILHQMAGAENLTFVGFDLSDKPSNFVEMISDPEHDLWPPIEGAPKDPRSRANRLRIPVGLEFSADTRQFPDSAELVFSADDSANTVIVKGYEPGQTDPVYEYEWDFPTNSKLVMR